eukprot:2434354-Pyramimonas_sp.AAC.1
MGVGPVGAPDSPPAGPAVAAGAASGGFLASDSACVSAFSSVMVWLIWPRSRLATSTSTIACFTWVYSSISMSSDFWRR